MTDEYILYTGIGSNSNGRHDEDEFITIMFKNFVNNRDFWKKNGYQSICHPEYLKTLSINQWIEWAGASRITTTEHKIVPNNNQSKSCRNPNILNLQHYQLRYQLRNKTKNYLSM